MTVAEKTYTLAEFMALPDAGKRYELVEGRLVEMPGPSYKHGAVIDNLYFALRLFVTPKGLGRVLPDTAFSYLLNRPNNARRPDLAFIPTTQVAQITDEYSAVPFAPDLAVEVVSPSDVWSDVQEKVAEYLHYGVRLVWVISPFEAAVYVYRSDGTRGMVFGADGLDGADVLPGFTMKVSDLFVTR